MCSSDLGGSDSRTIYSDSVLTRVELETTSVSPYSSSSKITITIFESARRVITATSATNIADAPAH